MEMKLYKTLDNENVINKELELKHSFNIKLKNTTDIVTPTIIINDKNNMNFTECNYCYLSDFNRYYFIRTIESMNNNLWGLHLECDVLESFKNDILNSHAEYEREIKKGDYLEVNNPTDVRKEIAIYESEISFDGEKNIVFSTIGGVSE